MKFKQKIVAAAMACGVAGPAFADITLGGNGELFWTVFDFAGDRAYTRDLGITMDAFLAGTGAPFVFTPDATFTSFLAGTANAGALTYNITAGDVSGGRRFLTTGGVSAPTGIPTTGYSTTVMTNIGSKFQTFVGGQNALPGHGGATDNLSVITTPTDTAAYAGTLWGSNFAGAVASMTNTVGIGDVASLYLISQATQAVAGSLSIPTFNGQPFTAAFNAQTGSLTVQAIPEPSTYAMMGLGLVALGIAARRRATRA